MAYQTEFVYLSGKAKWVRNLIPTEHGDWRCTLYPDAASLDKIKEMQSRGLMNHLKKDEDGYYMQFKRPTERKFKAGTTQGMLPPLVVNSDGEPLIGVMVGNGSDVTIKLEVYPFNKIGGSGKAIAARWASMRVDNLIPYEREKDFTPQENNSYRGLGDQPKPNF